MMDLIWSHWHVTNPTINLPFGSIWAWFLPSIYGKIGSRFFLFNELITWLDVIWHLDMFVVTRVHDLPLTREQHESQLLIFSRSYWMTISCWLILKESQGSNWVPELSCPTPRTALALPSLLATELYLLCIGAWYCHIFWLLWQQPGVPMPAGPASRRDLLRFPHADATGHQRRGQTWCSNTTLAE